MTIYVQRYIQTRDAFSKNGGEEFLKERNSLRADFCACNVSAETLSSWLAKLPQDAAKEEFSGRFAEWNFKLQNGSLTKVQMPTLSESDFMKRVDNLYKKYSSLLNRSFFQEAFWAKTNLRTIVLEDFSKGLSVEQVATNYDIKDKELLSRMEKEWLPKAIEVKTVKE